MQVNECCKTEETAPTGMWVCLVRQATAEAGKWEFLGY